jgi:proline iminopeptidase
VSTGAAGYRAGRKIDRLDRVGREQSPELAKQTWMQWTLAWYQEDRSHLRDLMRDMMEDYSAAVWRDPMRGKYPREYDLERVHEITVPTLIVAGRLDRIFVPLSEELHRKMPSSRLVVYDDVGHMINLEAPRRFNRDLEEHLSAHRPRKIT